MTRGGGIRTAFLILAVLVTALARSAVHAADASYRLGPGDRVKVTVFGHDDLSGEFAIDGAGRLSLPLIREVTAAGISAADLELVIAGKLKPDYVKNPRVSVEVLTYRPFYIIGEVKNPGSYPYVSGMTVVNAVALAGGFTYRADDRKVTVIRGSNDEQSKRQVGLQTPVLPGDVIRVGERFF